MVKIKTKNKKGWIKVVEAFMAVVLLLGFVMIVATTLNNAQKNSVNFQEKINQILNGVEVNSTLRNQVLGLNIPSSSSDGNFPVNLKNYLNSQTPSTMNCTLSICGSSESCFTQIDSSGDVYSSERIIFSNSTLYSPRKLKIFCY